MKFWNKIFIEKAFLFGMVPKLGHFRKIVQKYLLSFENCCWRRTEKVKWTDGVENEVLQRVKNESSILHAIKRKKANCIVQI